VNDEPSNTASKYLRSSIAYFNMIGCPPEKLARASVTDDFVYSDRRSGPSFPDVDAEGVVRFFATIWETGAGRPRWVLHEILAIRGERIVAGVIEVDYGNGMIVDTIEVVELDSSVRRLQRVVDFDADDIDGAIAELDWLARQADAS